MILDAIPLWAFFVAIALLVMGSLEGGYRLGLFAHKRSEDEKESPVSVISGSILGLGAFVLAFTFGLVANRFDYRKELVREDANAIRIAWMRSEFLPEPDRAETKEIMRGYLGARLALARSVLDPERVKSFTEDVEQDQNRLWGIAVANARKDMNSDVAALYVESLNEMCAIHALRVAVAFGVRIPAGIWIMLLVLISLGMISVGYQTGIANSKRSMAQFLLAVSFALVLALIAEMDHPDSTLIRVPQQPLIDLQTWMSEGGGRTEAGE